MCVLFPLQAAIHTVLQARVSRLKAYRKESANQWELVQVVARMLLPVTMRALLVENYVHRELRLTGAQPPPTPQNSEEVYPCDTVGVAMFLLRQASPWMAMNFIHEKKPSARDSTDDAQQRSTWNETNMIHCRENARGRNRLPVTFHHTPLSTAVCLAKRVSCRRFVAHMCHICLYDFWLSVDASSLAAKENTPLTRVVNQRSTIAPNGRDCPLLWETLGDNVWSQPQECEEQFLEVFGLLGSK